MGSTFSRALCFAVAACALSACGGPAGAATPAALSIAPQRLDFGRVTVGQPPPELSFWIRNSGGEPLVISRLSLIGPDASRFSKGDTNGVEEKTIPPGGLLQVQVTLSTTEPGRFSALLRTLSDAGSLQQLPITAEVVAAGP
jgi:hypothetical protein